MNKRKKLTLHRETVRTLADASLHRAAGRQNRTDDSDYTICDLCPETTPSKCILCCEPTYSCQH